MLVRNEHISNVLKIQSEVLNEACAMYNILGEIGPQGTMPDPALGWVLSHASLVGWEEGQGLFAQMLTALQIPLLGARRLSAGRVWQETHEGGSSDSVDLGSVE